MSFPTARIRRSAPGIVALTAVLVLFFVARLPTASGAEKEQIAARYRFAEMPIAMPPGYQPTRTVRQVNPAYYHIRSWISSVGAAVALNDLWGRGRADSLCLVDPRTDQVVVTHAPTAPAEDRFTPFTLNPAPLPMDNAMAPMGCAPGDFNEDGRTDLLVYYWGRTPILFLARADAKGLSASTYAPAELVPVSSADGRYHGRRWNTNAVNIADMQGTGHPDIYVGNYFPDSDVLDPHADNNVTMNSSMSNAKNAGGAHVLRWYGGTSGTRPNAQYVEDLRAVPYRAANGWTLAVSSADLTGEGKADLYVANDFGKDHLLYNVSEPGRIKFVEATGDRAPTTPKSFALGKGSFKGMGIDFGDLGNRGKYDMVVSNITSAWGLEESNFAWVNKAKDHEDMKRQLGKGVAPFAQEAQQLGLAWTGWGWDVKMGDFRNDGNLEVLQAEGFVKGKISRWPWLQEMAMTNDSLYTNPAMWPHMQPGDDIAGSDPMAFYSRRTGKAKGAFVNVSRQLGLAAPIPTRGIATADTRGTGALDLAVARQWGPPAFFANETPDRGKVLSLSLYRPASGGGGGLRGVGVPAYGASVQIRAPGGRTVVSQLDGGGGHSGKRSFEVRFGLGDHNGPVGAQIMWCDAAGRMHDQTLQLTPGRHAILLDGAAKEVTSR